MNRLVILLILAMIAVGIQPAFTQNKTKRKWYKAWVYDYDSNRIAKGYLYRATDSSIILIDLPYKPTSTHEIPVEIIQRINLRRNGSIARGFGIGFFGGFSLGAIPPLIDPSGEGEVNGVGLAYGMIYGVPLAFLGGVIGAVSGKKFVIDKNYETYLLLRERLGKYAFVK